MPIAPQDFKAPYIDQQKCWSEAEKFRKRYWAKGIVPVDILDIAEFELELEIRPITGLREECDIDALLLSDWKTLAVDQQQYLDDRFINRLRFSIAHELGHYVLHKAAFAQIRRDTPEDWIRFMSDMPDKEYSLLEFHANEFAGRLLVPLNELQNKFEDTLAKAERGGLPRNTLKADHLAYLCGPLSKHFAVSNDVIERRLNREQLWPLK